MANPRHFEPLIIAAGARAETNQHRIRFGLLWGKNHFRDLIPEPHTHTPRILHDRNSDFGLAVEKAAWGLKFPSTSFRVEWRRLGDKAGPARNERMVVEGMALAKGQTSAFADLVVCVAFPTRSGDPEVWDCVQKAGAAGMPTLVIPFGGMWAR